MKNIKLEFRNRKSEKKIAKSLSAMLRIGDSIFAGGDEGTCLIRLEARDAGRRFRQQDRIDLSRWFDLPASLPPETDGELPEIDLEGMDVDRESNTLWLIGSHSFKRSKADPSMSDADNRAALATVSSDANRFFLGCVNLGDKKQPRLAADGPAADGPRAAQLIGSATGSELLDALRSDPLLARFLGPANDDAAAGIPGKDNGFDIEGLACAPGGRLLLGLRGPVLRGIAIVLEIVPVASDTGGSKAGRLTLAAIGPQQRRYRCHFLDLGGNGIRDLCRDGRDLLILAGPSAGLDAPPLLFRWQAALGESGSVPERFYWQGKGKGTLRQLPLGIDWRQLTPGKDHAESITFVSRKALAIGYDSPDEKQRYQEDKDRVTVTLDVVRLR